MNAPRRLDPTVYARTLARLRSPVAMFGFSLWSMPLAVFTGLRVEELTEARCVVSLPFGWRTQNPFRSMHWAAQGIAAELATALHASASIRAAPVPVRMILARSEAQFTRMCRGRARYVFEQVGAVREALERTLASGASVNVATHVTGYDPDGEVISTWVFEWSFRARL